MKFFNSFKAALVVTALAITAQAGQTNVGAKGGLTFNKVRSDSALVATDSQTKFLVGAFVDHKFADYVNVQLELNYWVPGSGYAVLAIPVLYKAKFNTGTAFVPYVAVGPELDFKLKDDSSALKSISFGVNGGIGGEYWFTPKVAALLDVRYLLGLSNIVDGTAGAISAKFGSFQVLAGASFAL